MSKEVNRSAYRLALSQYLTRMRTDWRTVLPAMLLPGIGSVFVFYVPPLYVGKILALYGQQSGNTGQIWLYVAILTMSWLLGEAIWRLGIYYLIKAGSSGIRRLYNTGMEYYLNKDLSFFNDNFAGSLTKKIVGYAKNYEAFVFTLAFNVSGSFLPLIFVLFILWQFSPWLALTLVVLMAGSIALITPLVKRRQRLVTKREAASNVVAGYVADTLSNMPAVRAFAQESYEAKIHKANVEDYVNKAEASWHYHNMRVNLAASPLYVLTNVIGLVVAMTLGRGSGLGIEAVFITFTYYTTFTRVMWEFNHIYRQLETAISDAAQFTELLLDEPQINDPDKPKKFKLKKGEVEFKAVQFRYSDSRGTHLFDDFNLQIQPGEKVGLVGHSGGGKTTVTKLLMRFMDVDNGQVLIDAQDIKSVRQNDFRQHIAYVPQEPVMFHRSIADNIRYGNLSASDAAVKKAAKLAHAAEFIEKLPKGYETLVGERGVKLSGGQRQRVAIARSILKDAPILVLDEATSSLDSESEKLIQDALWKLMEGRTAIVIAHRLSTIQKMDRIVVLEEGKIVEEGTHKELLNKDGVYAGLWKHQSGGFLEE